MLRYKLCRFSRLSICGCSSLSRPVPDQHCYPASAFLSTCNARPPLHDPGPRVDSKPSHSEPGEDEESLFSSTSDIHSITSLW